MRGGHGDGCDGNAELLDRLFAVAGSAFDLVLAASLREITLAFAERERRPVGQYEKGHFFAQPRLER